jgi:glutamate decarboxylase
MPLHGKVGDDEQDAELEINPVYVREAACEIPRYRLAEHGVLPDTALQAVRDELILDGNARLNLATFVTTWMEPQAAQLRQEHDRQGRVPADRGARAALRQHPR